MATAATNGANTRASVTRTATTWSFAVATRICFFDDSGERYDDNSNDRCDEPADGRYDDDIDERTASTSASTIRKEAERCDVGGERSNDNSNGRYDDDKHTAAGAARKSWFVERWLWCIFAFVLGYATDGMT